MLENPRYPVMIKSPLRFVIDINVIVLGTTTAFKRKQIGCNVVEVF